MEGDCGRIVDQNIMQMDSLDMSILTKINMGNNSYENNPHLGILVYINSCNCEFCELKAAMLEIDDNPDFECVDKTAIIRVDDQTDMKYLEYCVKSLHTDWSVFFDESDMFLEKYPFINSSELSAAFLTIGNTAIKIY